MNPVIRIESFPEESRQRIVAVITQYTGMYGVHELLETLPAEIDVEAESFEALKGELDRLGCNRADIIRPETPPVDPRLRPQYEVHPWKQLSDQIRGEFIEQEPGKYAVRLRVREWSIVLDHYEEYDLSEMITYTRMRALYENQDGFWFDIFGVPPGWKLLKLFRARRWPQRQLGGVVIRANDAFKLRALLANPRLQDLIQTTSLWPGLGERVVCRYSTDVLPRDQVLYFESAYFHADVERISPLFDLFAEMLLQLRNIGSASARAPNVVF